MFERALETLLRKSDVEALTDLVRSYGGYVVRAELASLYSQLGARMPIPVQTLIYTSLSDGKYIFSDTQRTSHDGILAWDIAHLFGHMCQWNMRASVALSYNFTYHGEVARTVAAHDFRGASAEEMGQVLRYEVEANTLAFSALLGVRGEANDSMLARGLRRAIRSDLCRLVHYYLTGDIIENEREFLRTTLGREIDRSCDGIRRMDLPCHALTRFHSFDILSVPILHLRRSST